MTRDTSDLWHLFSFFLFWAEWVPVLWRLLSGFVHALYLCIIDSTYLKTVIHSENPFFTCMIITLLIGFMETTLSTHHKTKSLLLKCFFVLFGS